MTCFNSDNYTRPPFDPDSFPREWPHGDTQGALPPTESQKKTLIAYGLLHPSLTRKQAYELINKISRKEVDPKALARQLRISPIIFFQELGIQLEPAVMPSPEPNTVKAMNQDYIADIADQILMLTHRELVELVALILQGLNR